MSRKSQKQSELASHTCLAPSLEAATAAWYAARHRFQNEAGEEQRDAYMKVTDELGQAIAAWHAEQPELAEQFSLWFDHRRY
jgi:hypothetical protein